MPGKEFFVSVVARDDVGWMPGRNTNFPGEDADQLKEISIFPENHDGGTKGQHSCHRLDLLEPITWPNAPKSGVLVSSR